MASTKTTTKTTTKPDEPLVNGLYHLDSYEEQLMKEVARLKAVISNATTAIRCASKQALKDTAIDSAIKILSGTKG